MGNLTIAHLVAQARDLSGEERTPFAETPWRPDSAVIWHEGDDTDPIAQDGKVFNYFLEPSIILEVIEGIDGESQAKLVDRVIQYAENDA